jgi:hypothetical protein
MPSWRFKTVIPAKAGIHSSAARALAKVGRGVRRDDELS